MTHIRIPLWLAYGLLAAALVCSCDPVPAIAHPAGQSVHDVPPA